MKDYTYINKEVSKWSRKAILEELQVLDPNGIYLDDKCKSEGIKKCQKSEAIEILCRIGNGE